MYQKNVISLQNTHQNKPVDTFHIQTPNQDKLSERNKIILKDI